MARNAAADALLVVWALLKRILLFPVLLLKRALSVPFGRRRAPADFPAPAASAPAGGGQQSSLPRYVAPKPATGRAPPIAASMPMATLDIQLSQATKRPQPPPPPPRPSSLPPTPVVLNPAPAYAQAIRSPAYPGPPNFAALSGLPALGGTLTAPPSYPGPVQGPIPVYAVPGYSPLGPNGPPPGMFGNDTKSPMALGLGPASLSNGSGSGSAGGGGLGASSNGSPPWSLGTPSSGQSSADPAPMGGGNLMLGAPKKKRRNFKNLNLPSKPTGAIPAPKRTADSETLAQSIADIAMQQDLVKGDLHASDFDDLADLGHGNGGAVKKVIHRPTGRIMARKTLFIDRTAGNVLEAEAERLKKQVVLELQILHQCHSPYIVTFYGAFVHQGEIFICMEHMDLGSLDHLYRKLGCIEEPALGKITVDVLEGLIYLYLQHRIVHRDVKPNNILVNTAGEVKLCDFGVSGEAINSLVKTFVGTSQYMSPERILGLEYSVTADVWALGISLMELAMGRFPFPPEAEDVSKLSVVDMLQFIVNEDIPPLSTDHFTPPFVDFVSACLIKDARKRPTPSQLNQHKFVEFSRVNHFDMAEWGQKVKLRLGK
ncbi:MAP kinase kinase (MEK) [Allomyces arbusculus]|nr:MAP kinase kinase (MEK) [Allomyces arbusculus]